MTSVPAGLEDRWPCFVLVEAGKATWTEVTEKMSMCDVLDLIDACNAINAPSSRRESADENIDF